jgi:carboxypeptidase D
VIELDTLGIVCGCIDLLSQGLSYPEFAYNNTYGIKAIDKEVYETTVKAFNREGGCRDRVKSCRSRAAVTDPDGSGDDILANWVCDDAGDYCRNAVEQPYYSYSGRGVYDIAHFEPDPFPPNYFIGYLNQHWVQAALGVPVNFTVSAYSVFTAFDSTGDYARGGYLEDIGYLLDNGVKVALMYGDRDYICNCTSLFPSPHSIR